MNSPDAVDNFINQTAKSNVALIVPLYGYWNDIQDNPVNGEVLAAVMRRVYSSVHNLIVIFVGNPETIPSDPSNPESVANILMTKSQAGNVKSIPVARTASYTEYVREGMTYALEETNAAFIAVLNPWVMIQEGGIDAIVDRANRADDAKIISGFNVRSVIEPESFDSYRVNVPKEEWNINFDFLCMPRFVAEMVPLDPGYATREFLEVDIFNAMRHKGFAVVSSQQMPIFTFDFPWKDYESSDTFEIDRVHFTTKWGFDPGIKYA